MSSSRKKHIMAEMKKNLEQRKAELEFNEREIIQHVKYISEETMGQLKDLLKETDKKKFLKAFPGVSIKLDKSLTALMMIKASLTNLESDESSTDCASDQDTAAEACDTATVEERTDESIREADQSVSFHATPGRENEASGSVTGPQATIIDTHPHGNTSTSSMSSHPSTSPSKDSNASTVSSETFGSVSASKETSPVPLALDASRTAQSMTVKPPEATQEKTVSPAVPREITPLVLPVGTRIEVVVSEVVSPSIFWIQPTQSRIEALMEEIRKYYSSDLKLPVLQPKVGMYCCACFTNDDCWYRARIIAIHLSPPSALEGVGVHVDVIYIDYGNRERIPVSRLRPLHPRFMTDPAQAVCSKLARVKPTGKGVSHWSTEETDFFTQMTFGRKLTAIVVRLPGSSCSSFDLPAVDLLFDHYINEKETRLVDVSKMMVSQKRALPDDQWSTTDSYHSQTTHTTDSELYNSPNPTTDLSQSTTPVPPQEQGKDQRQEEEKLEKKESGSSSGRKRKKRKTKKSQRHHDPKLSTEDTDVPYEEGREGRDTRSPDKEEARRESTSDTPVYESEYTTEKRVPGLCRTPETSCTETEDKQSRPPAGKASSAASEQTTPHVQHSVLMDAGTKVTEKDSKDQPVSCGSESARSSSPNSTSGVSSARSSMCVPQKNMEDPTRPGLISFNRKQEESKVANSQHVSSQEGIKDSTSAVETTKDHSKEPSLRTALTAEGDVLMDLTDQFFTCAEDVSEADSTDRDVARSKGDGQPQLPPAISKVDVIGRRYVPQRKLREGEQIQFAMSHIVSPDEFYIHLITPDAKKMDYLLEELNSNYSNIEKAGVYKPPVSWLSIGALCCSKFGEDHRWYRGVVEDIRGVRGVEDGRHVLVRYVDFGNEEWIQEHLLYPLDKLFCSLAPLAFKCGLARIRPPKTGDEAEQTNKDDKGSSSKWSEECKQSLIEMSEFEKLLTGKVNKVEGNLKKCTWLEVRDNSEGAELCLNQRLVDLGLASSTYYEKQPLQEQAPIEPEPAPMDSPAPTDQAEVGPKAAVMDKELPCEQEEEDEIIPDNWNPMVQHFSSEGNSYGVDMDDPGVAATGMKSTVERRVCKYYTARKRCYKGVNCPFEHPRRVSIFQDHDQQAPPFLPDGTHDLPLYDPPHVPLPLPRPHPPPPPHPTSPPFCCTFPPFHNQLSPAHKQFPSLHLSTPSIHLPTPSNYHTPPSNHPPPLSNHLPPPSNHLPPPPNQCPLCPPMFPSSQGSHATLSLLSSLQRHPHQESDGPDFEFPWEMPRHVWGKWYLMPPSVDIVPEVMTPWDLVDMEPPDNDYYLSGQENLEKTEVFWCNTSVSLPEPGEWVALQVTAVHTSVHFWAQLPFGPKPLDQAQREWTALNQVPEERKDDGETLSALQDSINAIYQKPYTRREDLSLLALGEIVCAQFSRDDSWYRARVVDVDAEANTVQVFYVDYGNCEWLIRSKARPAMPQFLHLPFQAVECFLGGIELLKPTSPKNQDLDRKLFEELTMDKVLVGRVITSDADILHVELYDTISSKHVNIGDALVKAGFAKHTRTTEQTTEDMSGQ